MANFETSAVNSDGDVNIAGNIIKSGVTLVLPGSSGNILADSSVATITNKTISGSSNTLSNIPQSAITGLASALAGFQPLSTQLSTLASFNSNGLITQTASGTFTSRSIAATSTKISITNGDGIAGNPSIDVAEANLNIANMTGTLIATRGGTGQTAYTVGDILIGGASNTLNKISTSIAGSFLRSQGVAAAPQWSTLILPNSATVGDILYSNSANNISGLTAVATGNALISGGASTAPSWGKIGLTTHISGTLPIANGGTGQITQTAAFNSLSPTTVKGDIIVFDGTNDISLGVGSNGQYLTADSTQATGLKWASVTVSADSQIVNVSALTTTSTSAVDLTGCSLVTAGTGTKTYLIVFSGEIRASANNITISVQLNVGGVVQSTTVRASRCGSSNVPYPIFSQFITTALSSGTTIKVQWFTASGTATMNRGSLAIQGV